MPAMLQSWSQRVRRLSGGATAPVFKGSVTSLRDLQLGHQSPVRQIFYEASASRCFRVTGCAVSAHLLRPPLQVDAAHRQCENRRNCVPKERSSNCPHKGIVLLWRPGGIRDPQHFEGRERGLQNGLLSRLEKELRPYRAGTMGREVTGARLLTRMELRAVTMKAPPRSTPRKAQEGSDWCTSALSL